MSGIDDLIRRLAPDGVHHRPLGSVGEFVRGNGLQKSDLTEAGFPAIHYGQVHTHYGVWATGTKSFTTVEKASKLRRARPGDLVIATTSEDDAAVGKATAWLGEGEAVVSGDAYVFRHGLDPRFVAYFFKSEQFQSQKRPFVTGTKVRRISGESLAKIVMPVPPLEVQREIVRILDHFTELEAELEAELKAELKARLLQYSHLRDRLMGGLDMNRIWRPMGEVGKFTRGRRFTRADVVEGGVPSIHYGEIYTHYGVAASASFRQVREDLRPQLRFALPGDVVIASVGETVEDVGKAVAWLGDEPVAIHDDTFGFRHSLNPKFVSYWMQTQAFHSQKTRHVASAKIKRLSSSALASVLMPVPPMDEQVRIVETLDSFDALVNDLGIGLPAERAARRKQLDFYRDKLLTFEEAPA